MKRNGGKSGAGRGKERWVGTNSNRFKRDRKSEGRWRGLV